MFAPDFSTQFSRDLKKAEKQGKDLEKVKVVTEILLRGELLGASYRDHKLRGKYTGKRECHLAYNWLLIYEIDRANGRVVFVRTGSHAELF